MAGSKANTNDMHVPVQLHTFSHMHQSNCLPKVTHTHTDQIAHFSHMHQSNCSLPVTCTNQIAIICTFPVEYTVNWHTRTI